MLALTENVGPQPGTALAPAQSQLTAAADIESQVDDARADRHQRQDGDIAARVGHAEMV